MSMTGPISIDLAFPAFSLIRADLHVGADAMQLVVSVYLIAFAVMTPLHGPLSDALGRKPVAVGGLGLYALASVGAALSTSLGMLLAFRALQGLSAGGATIIARTIVRDLYVGPAAQRLMSRVMMLFGIAPAIAPVLGGWLVGLGPWSSVFWFTSVFATALALVILVVLPETHLAADRSPLSLGAMTAGLLEVARSARFERVSWAITLAFAGQFLYIGAAAIFVVDLLGLGSGDFWVFFAPMIAGAVAGSWLSGRAAGRIAPRRLVTVSFAATAVAAVGNIALAAAYGPRLPYAVIGPALLALGVGVAFPTVQVALLDLFPSARGAAASMAAVMPLAVNAVLATLLAPLVTGSVLALAVAAGVLVLLGTLVWLLHLRLSAPA